MLGPLSHGIYSAAAGSTLLDNLISFWELEEAGGARADAHGSNNLTDNNTVGQVAGKVGQAAQFIAANNEYLSRASFVDDIGTSDFSWSYWFYHDTLSLQSHVAGGATGGAVRGFWFLILSATTFRLAFCDGSADRVFSDTTIPALSTATWYHAVITASRVGLMTLYINNVSRATLNISGQPGDASGPGFSLGATHNGFFFLNGRLDQVAYWRRVLTEDERASLYNAGAGLAYSEL